MPTYLDEQGNPLPSSSPSPAAGGAGKTYLDDSGEPIAGGAPGPWGGLKKAEGMRAPIKGYEDPIASWLPGPLGEITPARIANILPDIGGAVGGGLAALSGIGLPLSAGAAALGGASGEAIRQSLNQRFAGSPLPSPSQATLDTLGAGALQGAGELAGGLVGGGLMKGKLAKMAAEEMAAGKPTSRVIGEYSKRVGLGLTPGEITGSPILQTLQNVGEASFPGMIIAQRAKGKGAKAAAGEVEKIVGGLPKLGKEATGKSFKEGVFKSGEEAFDAEASRLYSALDEAVTKAGKGAVVGNKNATATAMKLLGAKDLKEAAFKLSPQLGASAFGQTGKLEKPIQQLAQDLLLSRPTSFADAHATRSKLGRLIREAGAKKSPETGALKQAFQAITQDMEEAQVPASVSGAWERARGFYKRGSEVYQDRNLKRLMGGDPEGVVDTLTRGSRARRLVKAVETYADISKDKEAGKQSLDSLRRAWLEKKVISPTGDLTKDLHGIKGRLSKNREVADVLFEGGEKSRLQRLELLGEAMSRVGKDPGLRSRTVNTVLGALNAARGITLIGGAGARAQTGAVSAEGLGGLLAWASHSPRFTRWLIDGFGGKAAPTTAANLARLGDAWRRDQEMERKKKLEGSGLPPVPIPEDELDEAASSPVPSPRQLRLLEASKR